MPTCPLQKPTPPSPCIHTSQPVDVVTAPCLTHCRDVINGRLHRLCTLVSQFSARPPPDYAFVTLTTDRVQYVGQSPQALDPRVTGLGFHPVLYRPIVRWRPLQPQQGEDNLTVGITICTGVRLKVIPTFSSLRYYSVSFVTGVKMGCI